MHSSYGTIRNSNGGFPYAVCPLWVCPFGRNLPSNISDVQSNQQRVSHFGAKFEEEWFDRKPITRSRRDWAIVGLYKRHLFDIFCRLSTMYERDKHAVSERLLRRLDHIYITDGKRIRLIRPLIDVYDTCVLLVVFKPQWLFWKRLFLIAQQYRNYTVYA